VGIVMSKGVTRFFKSIFAGIVGAGVFLMLCVFAFSVAKAVFMFLGRDLLLSKFNIITAIAIFAFFGFVYGVSAYLKKNSYHKLLTLTWINFLVDVILSAIFTFLGYIFIRSMFGLMLGIKGFIAVFIILFVMFYLFSAILANYLAPKRRRVKTNKTRNVVLFIVFNPIFILLYLWLFGFVVYNSIYIPCTVSVVGTDANLHTANTLGLNITPGERILSIDGTSIRSLQDVKQYINSMESTKEVSVETENNLYYIKTYEVDGKRYMGLLLRQGYCERKYN
jgi:hypothetical protein